MALSEAGVAWAKERGISAATLARLGVRSGTTEMPGTGRCEVIAFPYWRNKALVNVKYRALGSKSFRMKKDGELRLWNLDAALSGPAKEVFVTEGEMDALALVEAGIPAGQVLSVPNGAPAKQAIETNRYGFVDAALAEGLSKCKRFVLVTDADAPGRALRQDLVRIIGPARCWFVEWPQGIKDANDFLMQYGAGDLASFVREDMREWPVKGIYRLSQVPEPEPLEIWRPGFPEWESKLGFAPTTVSIVTGQPNHGKTAMMMQLWYQIARDYNIKAAIASFETQAKPHHRRKIRELMFGKIEKLLSEEECQAADAWNDEHFLWLIHPNRKPSLGWILEMAEVAVIRDNVRVIQIDPWNTLEADRPPDQRETDYIGQCLDVILDFARTFGVHFQIVAHPAKSDSRRRGERPSLEDIAGSKHWDNKSDLGLCMWRPKMFENGQRLTAAQLFVLKSRYSELGYPCRLSVDYSITQGRFVSADYD